MYRKGNERRNPSRRYEKAFYFVDNLRENVLGNVYSLYDMELKLQGRVHSGKLRIFNFKSTVIKINDKKVKRKTQENSLTANG